MISRIFPSIVSLLVLVAVARGEPRIASFDISPGEGTASFLFTGASDVTRYVLESSDDLSGEWNAKQFRLARGPSQRFEASFPAAATARFFRVAEAPFSTAMAAGYWQGFGLNIDNIDNGGWITARVNADADGNLTFSSISWSYPFPPDSFPATTASFTGDGSYSASDGYFGVMSLGGNLLVTLYGETIDESHTGAALNVVPRVGGTGFTTPDLAGDWTGFRLTAKNSVDDEAGWFIGKLSFNASGIGTWTSAQRSAGDSTLPDPLALAVADDGSISGGGTGADWTMTIDKDLVVLVENDGGGGVSIGLLMRAGGSGFATADLEGHWRILMLTAQESSTDWVGYFSAHLDVDDAGTGTWSAVQRSNGDSLPPPPLNLGIADDGSIAGGLLGPGVLSLSKDLFIFVSDDGGGGVNLGLGLRN